MTLLCTSNCAITLRDKNNDVDLSGAATIRWRTRISGFRYLHPIIKLADGKVLRFSCTALSDGGRMLSYTPVTDLVRHTDHASNADYHRSLRTSGEHGLVRHLRAAE